MKPLLIINTHPIQYFAPLYQKMEASSVINLTVFYCSDESVKANQDKEFGAAIEWDIPLLQGYNSLFLKNNSWKPSVHNGFWGLINLELIYRLRKTSKSILWVHGWGSCSLVIAIIFGKIFGHTVCLRGETPLHQELKKNRFLRGVKNVWLRFLFLFVDDFFYIGEQNRLFYKSFNIKPENLLFTPYSVDNDRFQNVSNLCSKEEARKKLNLPGDKKIVLFSGKYIKKKNPLDLLKAVIKTDIDAFLVMVGEGELRPKMELFVKEHGIEDRVMLTGFVNQSLIPYYYASADVFVMCSGMGETWGLSVNEAMNFGLPCVVSETCGCSYDLVDDSKTGFVFDTGNIAELTDKINRVLHLKYDELKLIKTRSIAKLQVYSYDTIISNIISRYN